MQLILAPASSRFWVNQGSFNVTAALCRRSSVCSCRINSHRMDKRRAEWEKGAWNGLAAVNLQLVNLPRPRSLYEITFFQRSALLYPCMHGRLLRQEKNERREVFHHALWGKSGNVEEKNVKMLEKKVETVSRRKWMSPLVHLLYSSINPERRETERGTLQLGEWMQNGCGEVVCYHFWVTVCSVCLHP